MVLHTIISEYDIMYNLDIAVNDTDISVKDIVKEDEFTTDLSYYLKNKLGRI